MKDKTNRFQLTSFNDIDVKEVEWLWKPYFPMGKISFIAGDPGSGKSFQTILLASIVSKGAKLPLSEVNAPKGAVIIQNGEDGAGDTIKKRLISFHADYNNIYMIDLKEGHEESNDIMLSDISELDELFEVIKPKLVIFDPITAFLGDVDMNSATKTRMLLKPIGKLAEKHNCAIVFVIHRNKGLTGGNQIYRLLGSIDFGGIARSIVTIAKGKDEMLFIHTKSNLAERGKTLAFKMVDDKIEWLGERDYEEEQQTIIETKKPRDIAKDFIFEYLTQHKNSEYKDIVASAELLGISETTLERAKDDLKRDKIIDKKKENNIWYWYLVDSTSSKPHM